MLLGEILTAAATNAHGVTAVTCNSKTLSFSELDERADAWAGHLLSSGSPGDRIAILAENCVEFVEVLYGTSRAGAIAVPLNYRFHPSEWIELLQLSGATTLVAQSQFLDRLTSRLDETVVETVINMDEFVPTAVADFESPALSETDVVWLIATSGTTGTPKLAMITHRSLGSAIDNLAACRPIASGDVLITPFPMCHIAVYNVIAFHANLRTVVLLPRFDPQLFTTLIASEQATTLSLAPTMIASWLDSLQDATADLSSIRTLGYGASAIPTPLLVRAIERLGVDLSQGYGMTELSGNAAFMNGEDHRLAANGDSRLLGAAGRSGPLVELRVVDASGAEAPAGEVGEVEVRGNQVCAGYWGNAEATSATFGADGWFQTGDLGRIDDDGLLSIVDRKKDVIVTGGENVASREVERALEDHPAVKEVAVVGVPDPVWGENICAVVVPCDVNEPPALEELATFVAGRLAGFKKPKRLEIRVELPKNATGKVQKQVLRDLYRDY